MLGPAAHAESAPPGWLRGRRSRVLAVNPVGIGREVRNRPALDEIHGSAGLLRTQAGKLVLDGFQVGLVDLVELPRSWWAQSDQSDRDDPRLGVPRGASHSNQPVLRDPGSEMVSGLEEVRPGPKSSRNLHEYVERSPKRNRPHLIAYLECANRRRGRVTLPSVCLETTFAPRRGLAGAPGRSCGNRPSRRGAKGLRPCVERNPKSQSSPSADRYGRAAGRP
jgi:hypothetical protein